MPVPLPFVPGDPALPTEPPDADHRRADRGGARTRGGRVTIVAARLARRPGFWLALLSPLLVPGCLNVNSEAVPEIAAETMPRPAVILVSDFAIDPEETDLSRFGGTRLIRDTPRSAIERAVGHRFASAFAADLVDEIRKMGLPAERAGAPLAAGGPVLSVEGQFISLASGDPTAPGIIGFTADWANVVADIQIYSRSEAGDRLSEDLEFDLAEANQPPERMPSGVLVKLRDQSSGLGSPVVGLPPATAADLDAAAAATARVAASQLATFFADQGWIRPAQANS